MGLDLKDLMAVRTHLNITQEHAARLLGISKNTLIRWEKRTTKRITPKQATAGRLLYAVRKRQLPLGCVAYRRPGEFEWENFRYHLPNCEACRTLVSYLAAVMDIKL